MISTIIRLPCADAVTSWRFGVTSAAGRELRFLQDHLPAVMLSLLHHGCEITHLLAGRQARWVGIAPQSCLARGKMQSVAWFSILEIKDKDMGRFHK